MRIGAPSSRLLQRAKTGTLALGDTCVRLRLQYSPEPEHAVELAELAVAAARNVDKIELDYSPQSLTAVDRILESFHREGLNVNQIGETVFSLGCYVGEVLVRHNRGVWKLPKQTAFARILRRGENNTMVVELPDGTVCNPIGKAFKFLEDGKTESVAYFYQVFAKAEG